MAVERTLTDEERTLILRRVDAAHPALVGTLVADWLEMADNRDLFIAECELTWDRFGKELVEGTQPGVATVVRLATVAAATMYPDDRERMMTQAHGIALDALEGLGL